MGKMENMPICDLRDFTDLEVIRGIEIIRNVALLVMPKDAPGEVLQALHAIPMQNVAATVSLPRGARVNSVNGVSEIGDGDLSKTEPMALIVNGIAIIPGLSPDVRATLYVNGLVLINEKLRSHPGLEFAMINGLKIYASFDKYKIFPDRVEVDRDFLTWLPVDTAVIAGNRILVAKDVTVDLLQMKRVSFVAGNRIICPKSVLGYIKSVSTVGNRIVSDEDKAPERDDCDTV